MNSTPVPGRQSWAKIPEFMIGQALILGGVLSAIAGMMAPLLIGHYIISSPYEPSNLAIFLMIILANLALLLGVAAMYMQWSIHLDLMGRLGLLVTAIGLLAVVVGEAFSKISNILENSSGRVPAPLNVIVYYGLAIVITLTGTFGSYVLSLGMVLIGIYVLHANNLLPGWAKALPLIIGIWGLFAGFIPIPRGTGMYNYLFLVANILWMLLGVAFLSKQFMKSIQSESGTQSQLK